MYIAFTFLRLPTAPLECLFLRLAVRVGGCALLAMVTQIEPPQIPPLGKQVLIGMPDYPVLS